MAYLKFGFHTGPTGPKPPFSFYQTLDSAGIPFTLKITDAAPDIQVLDLARNSTVPHTIVYRRSVGIKGGIGVYDVPDYSLPANVAAKEHFDLHFQELPPEVVGYRDVCWIETINETNKDDDNVVEWTAEFSIYHSQYWLERGFKYLCFGWAGGCPEPYHWRGQKMLDLLRYVASKPNQLGISLHEYALSKDIWNGTSAADGSHWLIGRFEHLHEACDDNNIMRPRIVMTEWGWGKDEILLPGQQQRLIDYDEVGSFYAQHANIQGAAIWCLNQGDEWGAIHTKINSDIESLLQMTLNTVYPEPPIWPDDNGENPMPKPTDCPFFLDVRRFCHLIPQNTNESELLAVAREFHAKRNTFAYSHDDALLVATHGNERSEVMIWNPERWSSDIEQVFIDAGVNYQVAWFAGTEPNPEWIKLSIPHMPQFGSEADARSNDCGAAAVAMVVNGQTNKQPSVDNVATKYQNPPNSYMNFTQLDTALNGYGMDGIHKWSYFPEQINNDIQDQIPVIALVWYQSLPYKFSAFNGSHFIVIYATNSTDKFMYRDPLCPDGRDLIITFEQLRVAMRDAQNNGNQPNQGMTCKIKNTTGKQVAIRSYFEPVSEYGRKIVFRFPSGKTQPQQLRKMADGTICLFKGDGQTIDGKFVYDYERFFFDAQGNLCRLEDTSVGERSAYSQNGARWLPPVIVEGVTYINNLILTNYDRISCQQISEIPTTDYLTFVKFHPTWTSPQNPNITIQSVCQIEWRKSIGGKIEETYYLAEGILYGAWNDGAIHEWADGQQNINGQLWGCG